MKYLVGNSTKIVPHPNRYDGTSTSKVLISAVDSMASRKEIWGHFKASEHNSFFIDARMGGLHYEVYTCNFGNDEDYKAYEASLFDDSEATPIPCTEKAIIFNTMAIGADIASIVRLHCQRQEIPRKMICDMHNISKEITI